MLLALVRGLFRALFWNALGLTLFPRLARPLVVVHIDRLAGFPSVTSGIAAANPRAKGPADEYG